jgi:hypothetical protein
MENTLLIEHVYKGGRKGNSSDDPLHKLIGVSNQGGFRYIGSKETPRLIVLKSSMQDPDWPDDFDIENGIYTYYGDNKTPGHELHDTPRFGNLLLRSMFEKIHAGKAERAAVPPVLIFATTGEYRDVKLIGLAVPGADNLPATADLVAVWKIKNGQRFQNYQAKLTILDAAEISMAWIEDVKNGNPLTEHSPKAWRLWVETGVYRPLKATRTLKYRVRQEQMSGNAQDVKMIAAIHAKFKDNPYRFEACAAKIAEYMLKNIVSVDLTRPSRDGGRDAIGKFRIGDGESSVLVDFALEAKCYGPDNAVTVKDLSRLISRLRHRQFGVLVTTSYIALQAYQEIKEDEHPVVLITAVDIIRTLRSTGVNSMEGLTTWLQAFDDRM